MGISVNQWRAKIGLFGQKVTFHCNFNRSTSSGCNKFLVCIIAVLLLIGGVEPNPGPTVAELAKKLDDFIISYQTVRDQLLPDLSSRLDAVVKELSDLMNNTNEAFKQQNLRLLALEKSVKEKNAPANSSLCIDQNNGLGPSLGNRVTTTETSSSNNISSHDSVSSIERVVNNVLEKNKRKRNIMIFNLPDTDSFFDDKSALCDLLYDLELSDNMIESIERIGRLSTNDRPLKVQLYSEQCRNEFLNAAYRLKALTRKWPKLGIAPDRTPNEVETHRKLIKEFRRRQSSGELVQLDGDKIISVKNHNSYPPRNQSTVTSITNTQLSSDNLSLPLRVALPAINSLCKSDTLSATASVFCPSSSSISESNSSTTLQEGN